MHKTKIFKVVPVFVSTKDWKHLQCSSTGGCINDLWHTLLMEHDVSLKRNEDAMSILIFKNTASTKIHSKVKNSLKKEPTVKHCMHNMIWSE